MKLANVQRFARSQMAKVRKGRETQGEGAYQNKAEGGLWRATLSCVLNVLVIHEYVTLYHLEFPRKKSMLTVTIMITTLLLGTMR